MRKGQNCRGADVVRYRLDGFDRVQPVATPRMLRGQVWQLLARGPKSNQRGSETGGDGRRCACCSTVRPCEISMVYPQPGLSAGRSSTLDSFANEIGTWAGVLPVDIQPFGSYHFSLDLQAFGNRVAAPAAVGSPGEAREGLIADASRPQQAKEGEVFFCSPIVVNTFVLKSANPCFTFLSAHAAYNLYIG
jgi:hypothetical protein